MRNPSTEGAILPGVVGPYPTGVYISFVPSPPVPFAGNRLLWRLYLGRAMVSGAGSVYVAQGAVFWDLD